MSSKRTLLILGSHPFAQGGVSASVRKHVNSNVRDVFKVKYLRTGTNLGNKLVENLARIIFLSITQAFTFFGTLSKERISLIHIHTSSRLVFWRFCYYIFIARLRNVPVILHIHGAEFETWYCGTNSIKQRLIKAFLSSASHLIVLSNSWKIFFDKVVPEVDKTVIPTAIESFSNTNKKKSTDRKIKITFLGGLCKRKGLPELLEVIPSIVGDYPEVEFFVGGIPTEIELVNDLVRLSRNPLVKNSISIGFNISEELKKEVYESTDIFVLQSFNEGLPATLVEAMSHGIAIIATPVGGIPELITEGENGFLITPGDRNELEKALQRMLSNSELRQKMANNNRLKIKQGYTHEVIIPKILRIYENVLSKCLSSSDSNNQFIGLIIFINIIQNFSLVCGILVV